jgi:hypothetical protein
MAVRPDLVYGARDLRLQLEVRVPIRATAGSV